MRLSGPKTFGWPVSTAPSALKVVITGKSSSSASARTASFAPAS